MKCLCCKVEALYLMSGQDYSPDGKGRFFKDEPACFNSAIYCEESAAALNLPFSMKLIPGALTKVVLTSFGD